MRTTHPIALETLMRDYADIGARSRIGLRITQREGIESYTVSIIGIIRSKRMLILTAPVTEDGALVAVMSGQLLTCSWFSGTTAYRFRAKILRVLFEPVPLLHIELPAIVERRTVRSVPRALANLRATVKAHREFPAAIVDISTSGARLALHADARLNRGDELVLRSRPRMLHRNFDLIASCKVIAGFGHTDARHPDVQFFGVEFGELDASMLLVLHAYVQECLTFETDVLTQLLLLNSKEVADVE